MKKELLYLLIHEEIYKLPEDEIATPHKTKQFTTDKIPKIETMPMVDSVPELNTKTKEEKKELAKIPFAIFHSGTLPIEHELLQKIINACSIPQNKYKIFAKDFDQSVKFQKALVFTSKTKTFYTVIKDKKTELLYSKTLLELSKDQNEKAKLWKALKEFIQ